MSTERLEPCAAPSAPVRMFETQLPLLPMGGTVERYTTAHGVVFEKHTTPSGAVAWFRVVKRLT